MNYNFIKNLTTSKWMIDPKTMGALYPLVIGVFNGLEFSNEEPEPKTPIMVKNYNHSCENDDYINVNSISGVIMKYDMNCGPLGVLSICEDMLAADKDENCIAHILKIDSGGGCADAIPEWQNTIDQLQKPVIGYINGMACSAAIYMLAYCDYIYAHHNYDEVGCVGTFCEFAAFPQRAELEDGRIYMRIYADQATDKNAEFEKAIEGDVKLIKENSLNPHNEKFINDMKKKRPGCKDEQLKGSIYFASDVVGSFIDGIGTFEDAINKCIELSNVSYESENQQNFYQKIQEQKKLKMDELITTTTTLNVSSTPIVDTKITGTIDNENSVTFANLNSEIENLNQTLISKENEIKQLKDALEAATNKAAAETAEIDLTESSSNDPVQSLRDWYKNRKN